MLERACESRSLSSPLPPPPILRLPPPPANSTNLISENDLTTSRTVDSRSEALAFTSALFSSTLYRPHKTNPRSPSAQLSRTSVANFHVDIGADEPSQWDTARERGERDDAASAYWGVVATSSTANTLSAVAAMYDYYPGGTMSTSTSTSIATLPSCSNPTPTHRLHLTQSTRRMHGIPFGAEGHLVEFGRVLRVGSAPVPQRLMVTSASRQTHRVCARRVGCTDSARVEFFKPHAKFPSSTPADLFAETKQPTQNALDGNEELDAGGRGDAGECWNTPAFDRTSSASRTSSGTRAECTHLEGSLPLLSVFSADMGAGVPEAHGLRAPGDVVAALVCKGRNMYCNGISKNSVGGISKTLLAVHLNKSLKLLGFVSKMMARLMVIIVTTVGTVRKQVQIQGGRVS
ncbi:hypothetical protein C8J57DRAFT_1470488 [Mycena rebaudengoi]|nr:hypothetical protein C8J57DRAFT_1470488 [Mycena rebaudengoi]